MPGGMNSALFQSNIVESMIHFCGHCDAPYELVVIYSGVRMTGSVGVALIALHLSLDVSTSRMISTIQN